MPRVVVLGDSGRRLPGWEADQGGCRRRPGPGRSRPQRVWGADPRGGRWRPPLQLRHPPLPLPIQRPSGSTAPRRSVPARAPPACDTATAPGLPRRAVRGVIAWRRMPKPMARAPRGRRPSADRVELRRPPPRGARPQVRKTSAPAGGDFDRPPPSCRPGRRSARPAGRAVSRPRSRTTRRKKSTSSPLHSSRTIARKLVGGGPLGASPCRSCRP